jgi:hypothetical protein
MRHQLVGVLIVVISLACARPVAAQYISPAGLPRPAASRDVSPMQFASSTAAPQSSRTVGAAHGALVGAGIGAAAGLIVIAATPHSDHSEDAMGYIVGAAGGAFVGLIVGGIIGAVRAR